MNFTDLFMPGQLAVAQLPDFDREEKPWEVGDKEYRTRPVYRGQYPTSEDAYEVVLVERVIKDVGTYVATAETKEQAEAIAKALNEAKGL